LLIIDEMGKNISGTGMDTNVVGRKFLSHRAAPDEFPQGEADPDSRPDRGHARQRLGNSAWPSFARAARSSRPISR